MAVKVHGKVKHLSQTKAELEALDPIILRGEMVIESDTNKVKYGNGADTWNDLPYATTSIKWDIDTEYLVGDFVTDNGKLWTCIADDVGTEPGTDEDIWTEFTSGGGAKAVGEMFYFAGLSAPAGAKPLDYRTLSQSVYEKLYDLCGQVFAKTAAEATAAESSGLFHIPDGQYLFPRISQSWEIDDADINTSTFRITVTGHGLTTDGRPIKLIGKLGESSTVPTGSGYTEYDQNYIRVIDVDTIELYASEIEAIDTGSTTGRVEWSAAGTGNFTLTSLGTYQDDAFQGHWHSTKFNNYNGYTSGGNVNLYAGNASVTTDNLLTTRQAISDGLNGTPRFSNETRPANVGVGMYIQCVDISPVSGIPYDMLAWDSGWVDISDTTNVTIPITHNLDASPQDMIIEGWVDADGINPQRVLFADRINTAGDYTAGVILDTGSLSSFEIKTGQNGLSIIDESTGADSTSSSYTNVKYQVKLYKPNLTAVTIPSKIAIDNYTMTDDVEIEITEYRDWVTVDASSITVADKTLTVSQGGEAGIMNRLKFVGSDTVKTIVTDGTLTFWVEPGQVVDFYLKGTTLKWASAGWETIYDDSTNTSQTVNVSSGNIGGAVSIGEKYQVIAVNGAARDASFSATTVIRFLTEDQRGAYIAGTSYIIYDQSEGAIGIGGSTTYDVIGVQRWHNGS